MVPVDTDSRVGARACGDSIEFDRNVRFPTARNALDKYTDCVEVCPVDCFHEGPNFLAIDPGECIGCTLCVPECPAEAIFAEDDVPADQQHFFEINARLAPRWPVIDAIIEAPADADSWNGVPDKLGLLDETAPQATGCAPTRKRMKNLRNTRKRVFNRHQPIHLDTGIEKDTFFRTGDNRHEGAGSERAPDRAG